jgi:uncharacterized protein (DUF2141 family)
MVFTDLPAAAHALSVACDWNADCELDTNLVGIPTEVLGISHNVIAFFGPPEWNAAQFELQGDLAIDIELDTADRNDAGIVRAGDRVLSDLRPVVRN